MKINIYSRRSLAACIKMSIMLLSLGIRIIDNFNSVLYIFLNVLEFFNEHIFFIYSQKVVKFGGRWEEATAEGIEKE